MTTAHESGRVVIAPSVLAQIVALALREVPGIARPGRPPRATTLSASVTDGVAVWQSNEQISVACYVVAMANTDLLELGATVQLTVATALRQLVGVEVREVNIYIQDVEAGRA